jgi:hypothetical protein
MAERARAADPGHAIVVPGERHQLGQVGRRRRAFWRVAIRHPPSGLVREPRMDHKLVTAKRVSTDCLSV